MSDSPAPDSPPPLIYLDSETERGESPEQKSALYQSLAAAIEHPNCATAAWIDTVGDFKNNPRTFHDPPYNDGSAHWIDTGGHVLCMAFPAVLDLNGKYGRTGPYFSLAGGQGVKRGDIAALAKLKAVFELKPLIQDIDNTDDIPNEAIGSSSMAMNIIQTFFAKVEAKRNENVDESKRPAATPFHRTDIVDDCYKFVVNTGPLFQNLPDPGKTPIRAMSMDDLKSTLSTTLPSPTKMQEKASNSNLVEDVASSADDMVSVRTIADMPDPEGIYASALGLADFSKSSINVPNIRDANGAIIRPDEYEQKLESGMVVMVNVYMKLWSMKPSNKNVGAYRPKPGEQNGSRVYQLMLNSMQVLPVANISNITWLENHIVDSAPSLTVKRKGSEDLSTLAPNKKKASGNGPSGPKPTRRSKRANNVSKDDTAKTANAMELA